MLLAEREAHAYPPSPKNKIKSKGGNFGIGVQLGAPTGFSMKYFMAPAHAIQAGLGFGPFQLISGRAHVDYLWHPGLFVSNATLDLVPYLGLGIIGSIGSTGSRCAERDNDGDCIRRRAYARAGLWFRAPVLGLAFHWQKAPVDLFVEGAWTPGIIFDRDGAYFTAFGLDLTVGARWYF